MLVKYKEREFIIKTKRKAYINKILNMSFAKGNKIEYNEKYYYQNVAILKYKMPTSRIKEDEFFGDIFIENNINKCKLIIFNKEMELEPNLRFCFVENNYMKIKLKIIERLINMKKMFGHCLISISNISNWNTNNVKDMSYLFSNCSLLSSLPDISKWNINNVNNMTSMFLNCYSLTSIPDISNWNTNNVRKISSLFSNCSSLKKLPDIPNGILVI